MNITEHFLDSIKEIWEQYHKHPFVRGMEKALLIRRNSDFI